jgi:hypothetical protein
MIARNVFSGTLVSLVVLSSASLVQAQAVCPGPNLLENGDFSQGNQGFYSDYDRGCDRGSGQYEIVKDANSCNHQWHGFDHTTGIGNFMVENGAVNPGWVVWRQTVTVTRHIDYEFSGWVTSVDPRALAVLSILINEEEIGSVTAPDVVGTWSGFSFDWNSGEDISATISIIDETIIFTGNDFGIDDLCFARVTPVPVEAATWGSIKTLYR